MMTLTILLPSQLFLEIQAKKITAEAQNGEFCLLPKHVDFATVLASGLLTYVEENDNVFYVAVDGGTLVKIGDNVWVSTPNAVKNVPLGQLEKTVEESFKFLDEHEKKALSAVSKIEAGIIRKFLNTQQT